MSQTNPTAKTILITGSTDGIGKLTAIALAKADHHVYVHGRSADKLASVIEEIKSTTNNKHVDGFVADLSDLSAVKHLAEAVKDKLQSLDVLINNAGVFKTANSITKDGLDIRFVVNYFAPIVLTEGVLPLLKTASAASGSARIINLSSAAQVPVSRFALVGDEKLSDQSAYAQSKLALTMWSMDLAKQLKDNNTNNNINVIAVNPGSLLNTGMVAEAYGQHWSSADKGANVLTQLATSDKFAGETGKYFDNDLGSRSGTADEMLGDFGNPHPDATHQGKTAELLRQTQTMLAKLGLG